MAQSALRNCDICMAAPGTEYCLNCEQYFCNSCKAFHKRAKVSMNHEFKSGTNANQEVKPKCKEHNDDFIFLCSNCDVSVCKKCVSGKHAGHTMADINDSISNLKETAKKGIFSKHDLVTTNLQKMEHELNNFDSDVVSVIKAIKEDGSKIKAMVDKEVEQMIKAVKDQAKREKEKVSNAISITRSLREDAKSLEKRNENLQQKGEDASLIPKLKSLIDEMARLQVIPVPVFPSIKFSAKPVRNNDVINLLGTFQLSVVTQEKQKKGYLYRCTECGYEKTLDFKIPYLRFLFCSKCRVRMSFVKEV